MRVTPLTACKTINLENAMKLQKLQFTANHSLIFLRLPAMTQVCAPIISNKQKKKPSPITILISAPHPRANNSSNQLLEIPEIYQGKRKI